MTTLENLQAKALYINERLKDAVGGGTTDTPLIDIVTFQEDPLVNHVTTVLGGQVKIEERLAALKSGLYIYDLEGEDLTLAAQLIGTDRKLNQVSLVAIIVVGCTGSVLPAGATLIDYKGNIWTTKQDAVLQNGLGYVNACSPIGRFDLLNGELALVDTYTGVDKATNAAKPILGGEFENDESLRNRLTGKRTMWKVKGTQGSIESELEMLDGVYDAKAIAKLPDCFNDGSCDKHMIAVLGGDEQEIADTIYHQIPFSVDRLVGGTTVQVDCNDVKFQKMCPVLIEVRYWLKCSCPVSLDKDALEQKIVDTITAMSLSGQQLGANTLCCVSKDIIKVEFKAIPKDLGDVSEDCLDERTKFTDPITGEEVVYATDDPNSFCFIGDPECQDGQDCIVLQPWMYPVALIENVAQGEGCPCPTLDGCGCANS